MNRTRHFLGQDFVNAALSLDARQAGELLRNDAHGEMGLAPAAIAARGPGMTGMAGTVILHDQRTWRESGGEFVADRVGDAHSAEEAMVPRQSQAIGLLVFCRSPPIIDA